MAASQTPEISPSPTARGFKGVIAKARLNKKDDSSVASIVSADDLNEGGGIRASIDSLRRDSTKSSLDDGLPSGPSSMSKLIPGRVKKKRRQREEAERQLQLEESARGRSPDDQAATAANGDTLAASKSQSTLGEDEDNGLLTGDSDTESPSITRPPFTSRESHTGYLTSSSPLIKTTAASEDSANPSQPGSTEFSSPQYQKSSTLPTNASTSEGSPALLPQHAATFASKRADRSPGATGGSRSRGVSPGAMIKDALSLGSKKRGLSPPKSAGLASTSDANVGGLSGLLSKEKRTSLSMGRGGNSMDGTPQVNVDPSKSQAGFSPHLPAIVTTPRTPPSKELEAPETTVTPPTPTDQRRDSLKDRAFNLAGTNTNTVTSPSGNMISHRRVRSDTAARPQSKLSSAMAPPLTPMPEERTPGSRSPSANLAGGFFSSVFSAAQNVTSSLSNTIAMNQPRSRSSTKTAEENIVEAQEENGEKAENADDASQPEKKTLAIETLGSGDLSLSHLGIDTPATSKSANGSFIANSPDLSSNVVTVRRDEDAARADDVSALRAVSAAYSEKPTTEGIQNPTAEVIAPLDRPRSVYETSLMGGDQTPPNGSIKDVDLHNKRSSSVRSRVNAVTRKHRNSSSATGATIGTMVAGSQSTLAAVGAPKLTGFAVASKKRNRDFHQLFRSVPEDDYLIEDYSCALQREIILAGRIYISEGHICFSSNILGWVTNLVIGFDEVVSVEKENTAVVFPNAIAIQTLHARHTFRSLLSREATYELLIGIWKLSHPTLKSSVNGVRLDNSGTGDKTEKIDPSASDEASDLSEEEEVYDEDDDEEDGGGSLNGGARGSVAGSDDSTEQAGKQSDRKPSSMGVAVGAAAGGVPTASDAKATEKAAAASAATAEFPGPQSHEPTECSDGANHYDKILKDDIIPAPLGKVYSMVFGPASGGFMAKWLIDDIKVTELQLEDDKKGLTEQGQSRSYTYIKPLYAPIGPKTTKCLVTETLDFIDLERSVSVTASTQTPDVPSGGIFVTKTRFCFMWAPGNQTRAIMNYTIEWSGKSWIKGAIEKGATEGQGTYCNDLVKALKAGIATRPRAGSKLKTSSKPTKKRKGDRSASTKTLASPSTANIVANDQKTSSWGPLEPLHAILTAVGDILSPFISANMIIGFLVFVILFNYLRSPSSKSVSRSRSSIVFSSHNLPPGAGGYSPERIAAYEALWAREEADLWDWLEQRVNLHTASFPRSRGNGIRVSDPGDEDGDSQITHHQARQKALKDRLGTGVKNRIEQMKKGKREVEEAIKVTEERLEVLKKVVGGEERN